MDILSKYSKEELNRISYMYDIEDGQFYLEYDQWLTVLELWSDDLSDKDLGCWMSLNNFRLSMLATSLLSVYNTCCK